MKAKIYVWVSASTYSHDRWKKESREKLEFDGIHQILFNHHLKEYRKNFKCNKHQLIALIDKAKTIKAGTTETFTI